MSSHHVNVFIEETSPNFRIHQCHSSVTGRLLAHDYTESKSSASRAGVTVTLAPRLALIGFGWKDNR